MYKLITFLFGLNLLNSVKAQDALMRPLFMRLVKNTNLGVTLPCCWCNA